MTVAHRDAGAVRPYVDRTRQDAVGHRPEDFLPLPPHLFLLAIDEGHDVRGDVERRDAGISRTGERLVRRHMYVREVERVREGLQRKGQARDRAVRVRHDEAALSKRWLTFDEQEVVRIHFRQQERNVRVHTVSRRVGEDSHARLGGVRFDVPGDFRREGAERRDDVVRPEHVRVEWSQFHRRDVRGERNVFEPPEVFEVSADLSLGRGEGGDVERALRDAPRERQEAELAQPQEERHRLVVVVQGDVNERHPARTEQLPCFEHRLAVSAIAECDVAARGRPEIRSKQRMDASDPQAGPAHCSKLTLDRRLQAADVEEEGSWFHYRDRAQDLRGDGHRNGDRDNICLLHAFLKIWLECESFGWAGDVIHDDVAPARTEVSAEPLAHASRTADHQDTLVDWHGWDYSRLSAHTLLDQETGETRTER